MKKNNQQKKQVRQKRNNVRKNLNKELSKKRDLENSFWQDVKKAFSLNIDDMLDAEHDRAWYIKSITDWITLILSLIIIYFCITRIPFDRDAAVWFTTR